MKKVISILIGILTCGSVDAAAPAKPNILFILADDLSANCLSMYGNDMVKTPNLDRLAAEGAVFNHCYSTENQTSPCPGSSLWNRGKSMRLFLNISL